MPDFIPRRDAELLTFGKTFRDAILSEPSAFGVSVQRAEILNAVFVAFESAYATALEPLTRFPVNILNKDQCRADFVTELRVVANLVRATPGLSDSQKGKLGLLPRQSARARVGPPQEPPRVFIAGAREGTVHVWLTGTNSLRPGKVRGTVGAAIYTFVGEEAPSVLKDWKYYGSTSNPRVDVTFPSDIPPGAQVWVTACWLSPRQQAGPVGLPGSTRLAWGGMVRAA